MTKNTKLVIGLLALVVIIAIVPLFLKRGAEFSGADNAASEVIEEINPDYEIWADPIMEPASGEIESLLFCLQAGLGAGVFGFVMGRLVERKKKSKTA